MRFGLAGRSSRSHWIRRDVQAFQEPADLRTQLFALHIAPELPSRLCGRLLPQAGERRALACARLTEQGVGVRRIYRQRRRRRRIEVQSFDQNLKIRPKLLVA